MAEAPPIVIDGIGGLLAGPANVIMQLAHAPIGYGVLESKVESGQVTRHPVKRFRTTFTYISAAMYGDERERALYRAAVNGSHRLVRSDEKSPVRYNAFDKDLQLWVAACLYFGTVDIVEKLHGPLPDDQADALYEYCARFGTTLQVTPDMWPADRAAFAEYWDDMVGRLSIDEPVRRYLRALTTREHMPRVLRAHTRFNEWVTTGFLPQRFRDEMHYTWTTDDQIRFDRLMRRIGAVQRRLPGGLRRFPFNWFLWDLRLRIRFDRPLV
jgi:uncharacterized protein (DUF2236 family)